ncbi:MAG: DUF4197 domain-containing protein [Sphingomonadaceae bacterium]
MEMMQDGSINRRRMLGGLAMGGAMLALPGCMSVPGFGLTDAIKRILTLSSQTAFANLTSPDGFWDSSVARIGLPAMFRGGGLASTLLTSGPVKNQLQKALNNVAEDGAERAAPLVADAIRNISFTDAAAIIGGGPTAATGFLRQNMGSTLVSAMVPALGDAMKVANNPILSQAIAALSGVDVGGVAQALSSDVDNAIWAEMGLAESEIRANPESTNDPMLIAVLKAT